MLLYKVHAIPAPNHSYVDLKLFKAQYTQLRTQIPALSDLKGAELMIQSSLLQKLSKVTYEHITDRFHKSDFR